MEETRGLTMIDWGEKDGLVDNVSADFTCYQ